jgi:hypothetical protein
MPITKIPKEKKVVATIQTEHSSERNFEWNAPSCDKLPPQILPQSQVNNGLMDLPSCVRNSKLSESVSSVSK